MIYIRVVRGRILLYETEKESRCASKQIRNNKNDLVLKCEKIITTAIAIK